MKLLKNDEGVPQAHATVKSRCEHSVACRCFDIEEVRELRHQRSFKNLGSYCIRGGSYQQFSINSKIYAYDDNMFYVFWSPTSLGSLSPDFSHLRGFLCAFLFLLTRLFKLCHIIVSWFMLLHLLVKRPIQLACTSTNVLKSSLTREKTDNHIFRGIHKRYDNSLRLLLFCIVSW